jgi:16S rRNA A1518/A1519 N6-dimethyltransferase RsmA/KsgA/DIM1 with predicted DNA glycosylase/AP lyase activity
MGAITWGRELAEVYDSAYAAEFEPPVLDPIVDRLVELAGGGAALEFAVGTGRVALRLSERAVSVRGIELSPHMAEQLRAKPGSDAVPVTLGDMTTARVPELFGSLASPGVDQVGDVDVRILGSNRDDYEGFEARARGLAPDRR